MLASSDSPCMSSVTPGGEFARCRAACGFVALDRVLQSGIEELHYAERIARLRAYYFDFAPELTRYLASVPPARRLAILGLRSGYWPAFRTTAGMIGVLTAVLTG